MSWVSIAQVADHAGVSRTTVSHVVSGNRPVSAQVARRVRESMDELGYVPSRAAQSLTSGATNVIGLVIPDIGNGFFADLTRGVERTAASAGRNLLLGTTDFEADREKFHLRTVQSRAVDGVVYAAGAPEPGEATSRLLKGTPFVLVDEEVPDADASSVISDNTAGGAMAATHLAELGHRQALVLSAGGPLLSSIRRVEGFVQQFGAAGGQVTEVTGGFTVEGAEKAMAALDGSLREGLGSQTTAIFATNDMMALGAMQWLRRNGFGIPEDVSVVGFDDVLAAGLTSPPLTSVRQDAAELGRVATLTLLSHLDDPSLPNTSVTLPVELMVRRSSGAPSALAGRLMSGVSRG